MAATSTRSRRTGLAFACLLFRDRWSGIVRSVLTPRMRGTTTYRHLSVRVLAVFSKLAGLLPPVATCHLSFLLLRQWLAIVARRSRRFTTRTLGASAPRGLAPLSGSASALAAALTRGSPATLRTATLGFPSLLLLAQRRPRRISPARAGCRRSRTVGRATRPRDRRHARRRSLRGPTRAPRPAPVSHAPLHSPFGSAPLRLRTVPSRSCRRQHTRIVSRSLIPVGLTANAGEISLT